MLMEVVDADGCIICGMTVSLILSERRSELTESRSRNYAVLRERLGAASGADVEAVFYEDVIGSPRADVVVLSGSSAPWSAHDPGALDRLGDAVRGFDGPVLGICAGFQLLARFAGGRIGPGVEERGFHPIEVHDRSGLFGDVPAEVVVFHDHSDEIAAVPEGFHVLASSAACAVQAFADPARRWWGTQFHPEEYCPEHPAGERILRRFFAL
jgi:GMP synthase (glutamine-hydrolysing)